MENQGAQLEIFLTNGWQCSGDRQFGSTLLYWLKSSKDPDHLLIRDLSKIAIIETNRPEHLVVFEANHFVGLMA